MISLYITNTYNPNFLIITKKEVFSFIRIQTDNILILVLKEFLVLKNNKFNKTKSVGNKGKRPLFKASCRHVPPRH